MNTLREKLEELESAFNLFSEAVKNEFKIPEFVMTSEDGIPLYEGDEYFECVQYAMAGHWTLISSTYKATINSSSKTHPKMYKAFSTGEAAEAWIQEQNKPKCIDVKLFNRDHHALIYKDQIELYGGGVNFIMKPSDLEDMLHAYKTISKS